MTEIGDYMVGLVRNDIDMLKLSAKHAAFQGSPDELWRRLYSHSWATTYRH